MEINQYRAIIQNLLKEHASHRSNQIEAQTIFDKEQDHYQLVHVGWLGNRRVYGCVVHVDIKDGKIWIQYDGTEVGIANELVELGISKQDIVLGFQAPYKRKFTDFAVS